MQQYALKHDGLCLSKIYINSINKLIWKCSNGHIWEATPTQIQRGQWCPECNGVEIEPELLWALYWGNEYTQKKISGLFKSSIACICNKMKKYNIPIIKHRNFIESELLLALYWGNQYSIRKCQKILKTDVLYWMKMYNIPGRTRTEINKKPYCKKYRNKHLGISYKKWRNAVFKRDDYTCQICHKKGRKLNGHHIFSWCKYIKKRYLVGNGATLCFDCHKWVHKLKPLNQQ